MGMNRAKGLLRFDGSVVAGDSGLVFSRSRWILILLRLESELGLCEWRGE